MKEELKECPRCGSWMKPGHLAPPGELAVLWVGPKIGIIRHESAKIVAYRCSDCGMIQLESEVFKKA